MHSFSIVKSALTVNSGLSRNASYRTKTLVDVLHPTPPKIFVWNRVALDNLVNVSQDLEDYMKMRKAIEMSSNRFFLGFNLKVKTSSAFLQKTPLGKNSFFRIFRDVCNKLGITGCGCKTNMTTHGLRATTVTLLLPARHADAFVTMQTVHRNIRSLKA